MINEGLEQNDLMRLIHPVIHIDEFKSKMGKDTDVCVISFKVDGKEPALDLVNFIEKGYEWVIDADVSSGEMEDGDFAVFVELERDESLPENVMEMMSDIMNLTGQDLDEWRFCYYTSREKYQLDTETLDKMVPLNPKEYSRKFGNEDLDKLKSASGVEVTTKAPKNEFTESLRIAAGIR